MNTMTARNDHDYGAGRGDGVDARIGRAVDSREVLRPLLDRIRRYDDLRLKLETEGGDMRDMNRITAILTEPIEVGDPSRGGRDEPLKLVDRSGIRNGLFNLGCQDIHIDVRRLPTGMPVYYLCRIRRDYWSHYSLIVEDIYLSPGYPMPDERFVRLMEFGHEIYYLRLSPFRERIKANDRQDRDGLRSRAVFVDDLLYCAGRHVFQAAWHEDQRPGMLIAARFDLPRFKETIELLYLCLSGELCALRNATSPDLIAFFETAYPQPDIHAFLKMLGRLDGAAINDLPRRALNQYSRLARSFRRFLECKAPWGQNRLSTALHKIALANFDRLPMVADMLKAHPAVRDAARILENESQTVSAEILGNA